MRLLEFKLNQGNILQRLENSALIYRETGGGYYSFKKSLLKLS